MLREGLSPLLCRHVFMKKCFYLVPLRHYEAKTLESSGFIRIIVNDILICSMVPILDRLNSKNLMLLSY